MTIDKSALKALAEAATPGTWATDGEREVMSAEGDQLNSGWAIAQCQGPDNRGNARYVAAANPATILALLAEIEHLDSESLCPACNGSGEGRVMSDSGPDAHHIQVDCPECFGRGTMFGAYDAMKIQRDSQIERTTKAGGELFFMRIELEKLKAENEALTEKYEAARDRKNSITALQKDVEILRKDAERNNRILVASCITIGEICEALGIDNHSEPDMIVEAVRELKGRSHD